MKVDTTGAAASAGGGLGRGFYDRDRMRERLEEYQRDLEQELADVSDLLRRIGESEPKPETATA